MTARAERSPVPEQGPTEPKISITIAFSGHTTSEDARWVVPLFQKADVFVPESPRWNERTLKYYQKVSNGYLRPGEFLDRRNYMFQYSLELSNILHGTRKPVVLVDVPDDHSYTKAIPRPEYFVDLEALMLKQVSLGGMRFEDFLGKLRELYQFRSEAMRRREDYIVSQIKPVIVELWKKHPRLNKKPQIEVLLTLGSAHTPIYRLLKRDGEDVVWRFDRLPAVFAYADEVQRRLTSSDQEIGQRLLARTFLEVAWDWWMAADEERSTNDVLKYTALVRLVLSRFSFEDAKGIFEGLKRGQGFKDLFAAELKKKGVTLPTTEAELDAFLESRGIKFRKFSPSL